MQYGVCISGQAPVRAARAEASELVTQMLFGETCKIVDQKSTWYFVYTDTDQYLGWTDIKALHLLSNEEYHDLNAIQHPLLTTAYGMVQMGDQQILISQAAALPFLQKNSGQIGMIQYTLLHGSTAPAGSITEYPRLLRGAPYLWGGRTLLGIDCSALVFNTFLLHGIYLPRDAGEQVNHGGNVAFLKAAQPGDVCFFDNDEGKIVHTGILLEQNKIIHASGSVRIDPIDHQGIYNPDLKKYTHQLRIIKRIAE